MSKNNIVKAPYILLLLSLLVLFVSEFSKWSLWASAIQYPLLFLPKYWFVLILIACGFCWHSYVIQRRLLVALSGLALGLIYMDFKPGISNSVENDNSLTTIMSYNLGMNESAVYELSEILKQQNIQIAALQEVPIQHLNAKTFMGYYSKCYKGMCLISKRPIKAQTNINEQYTSKGWNYASLFETSIMGSERRILAVHLETPRKAWHQYLKGGGVLESFVSNATLRYEEASKVNDLKELYSPDIILGDFNMPQQSSIYKEFFEVGYSNAFSEKGVGFGFTKYTTYHGVRIDHILSKESHDIEASYVHEKTSSDHRPIISQIKLNPYVKKVIHYKPRA